MAEVSAPTVGDIDDVGNDGDDEVSLEEDLSFPFSPEDCSQMAKILGLGLLSPKSLEVQGAAAASMSASRSEFFLKRNDNIDVDLSASGDIFFGRHQEDDIFQDIFELDEAELNLPPWLLPTSSSKPIFSDDVSMSFASLPTLLKVEAAPDDEEDARANAGNGTCAPVQKPYYERNIVGHWLDVALQYFVVGLCSNLQYIHLMQACWT